MSQSAIPKQSVYQPHQPYPWVRQLYAFALYWVIPLVPLYLLWRSRKQPEYRQHWAERFGCYGHYQKASQQHRIWLHAVSLGETRATKPLVDALFEQQSDVHVILTCHTPTGRAAGQELFQSYLADGRMTQVYMPYDLTSILKRFFKVFVPTDVWVMETEVWPNMIAQCVRREISISLINGRLSDKTLRQTQKWPKLMRNAYAGFMHVCAQTDTDAQRYRQIGVVDAQLAITGNLKFDMKIPADQIAKGTKIKGILNRPIVMLASSREGEEQLWLQTLHQDIEQNSTLSNVQWWVVPRHPQRFAEVAELLQQSGKKVLRMTEWLSMAEPQKNDALRNADIVLGDTMGEMFVYYTIADVVLMGGTWLPYGGQNFLEPMALGKPVIVGESIFNFEQIGRLAISEGVLDQADGIDVAKKKIVSILCNDNTAQRANLIRAFVVNKCGAVEKTVELLF